MCRRPWGGGERTDRHRRVHVKAMFLMPRGVAGADVRLIIGLPDVEEALAILHEEAPRNWVNCFRRNEESLLGNLFHDVACSAYASVVQRDCMSSGMR